MSAPLLAVRQLKVYYPLASAWPWQAPAVVRAVDGVNFNLGAGEVLAVVGESGSGKSTLARALVGLQPATGGGIVYGAHNLTELDEAGWRPLRREIQMVFQDPLSSLDPRMTVAESVAEPLLALCPELDAGARDARVRQSLEQAGLDLQLRACYPHQLSGGQCQRVAIARALAPRPRLLVCDEPLSALDVSVQAQIVNLLRRLQAEQGLALVLIAHDLAVVRHLAQRVLVMYAGRVVEQAEAAVFFARPAHPYSRALLAAAPGQRPQPAEQLLDGELPSALHPPAGCALATRCPLADEQCARSAPPLRRLGRGGAVACHYVDACAGA